MFPKNWYYKEKFDDDDADDDGDEIAHSRCGQLTVACFLKLSAD